MAHYINIVRIAVFALFLFSTQAYGQGVVEEGRFSSVSLLELADFANNADLGKAFDKWFLAIKSGSKLEAFNESNRILGIMRQLGTRNLFDVADLCVAVGMTELKKGSYDSAILAGEDAVKFAPDHPAPYFFLAKALFSKDKANIKGVVTSLASGLKVMFSDMVIRNTATSHLARFAFLAVLLTFLFIFIVLFTSHYHALMADIAMLFPVKPEGFLKILLGALVTMAPLAIGGWLIFLLSIPLFLWPYLRFGGRAVVGFFALFVFLTPHAFSYMSKGVFWTNGDAYRAVYLLSKNTWDYETKRIIERENLNHPNNKTLTFAIGYLNMLKGDKDAAIGAYDAILKKWPKDTRAMVNKGNVYFMAKDYNKAVEVYEKAIKTDPQLVEAHFNLSNTYVALFKTKDAEREYKRALSIDRDKTAMFVEQTGANPDKKVIDFMITGKELAGLETKLGKNTEEAFKALWGVYLGDLSQKTYKVISLVFLGLIAIAGIFWRNRISHRTCASCGITFRPPIYLDSDFPKCNQCVAAQSVKGAVSTTRKDKKLKDIREYLSRRNSVANLLDRVYPGIGRVCFQEHFSGFIFAFIASLAIVYGVSTIGIELLTHGNSIKEVANAHVFFLGFVAFYWLLMNTVLKKDFY